MSLALRLKQAWDRFAEEFQRAKAERIPELRQLIARSKEDIVRAQKQLEELPGCIEKWEAELRDLSRPIQTPSLSEFLALALGATVKGPQPVTEKDTPKPVDPPQVFQETPRLELPGGGDT